MHFDVIIPTRGDSKHLKNILFCIGQQALQPQRVIFVVNNFTGTLLQLQGDVTKDVSHDMYSRIDWHIISSHDPISGNASYARNIGCTLAVSEYVYFIDDDNVFGADFFARTVAEYLSLKKEYKQDIVYSPTIMRRQSSTVQSQGIKVFHFLFGRPEPVIFGGWKNKIVSLLRGIFPLSSVYKNTQDYIRVQTIGGNSLFGLKAIFETHVFDSFMPFVYEDIDCLHRISSATIPVIVSKKNSIYHMERDKTILQQSFLGTPETALQKAKNRLLFVKKNATRMQLCGFYCVGLPITTLMTLVFILVRGGTQKWILLQSYLQGIRKGLSK